MKASRRVLLYFAFGVVCFAVWVPLQVKRVIDSPSLEAMSGLVLTVALAFVLLAAITRLEARVRTLEDFLRVEASRSRSREHDKDAPEPEPPAGGAGSG